MSDSSDGEMAWMPRDDFVDIKWRAHGSISTVSSAYHPSLGRVILKQPWPSGRGLDETERADLLEEIAEASSLRHDNIIRFFGCINDPDSVTLVMELASLGTLSEVMCLPNSWPTSIACRAIHHVALGMQHLHSIGIVHRTLNSLNVLMTEEFTAKITNCRITKWRKYAEKARGSQGPEETSVTKLSTISEDGQGGDAYTGNQCKLVAHTPPECFMRSQPAVPRKEHDVYSFAIFTWEALTAKESYAGCTVDEICEQAVNGERPSLDMLPSDLTGIGELVQRCWHEKPEERPDFAELSKLTRNMLFEFKSSIYQDHLTVKAEITQRPKERRASNRSEQTSLLALRREISQVTDTASNQGSLMTTGLQARDENDAARDDVFADAQISTADVPELVQAVIGCPGHDADEVRRAMLTEAVVRILAPTMEPLLELGRILSSQPPSSRRMNLAAMLAIESLRVSHGGFTYYQTADSKLVLHAASGMSSEDFGRLKQDFHRTVTQHIQFVELVYTDAPFDATLCSNGIGSTVFVDGHPQTIGMYVVYNGGQVFFLTTAHSFVQGRPDVPVNRSQLPSIEITARPEQADNYRDRVRIAEPFPCCSCIPFVGDRRFLLHYVDLMACPMPTLVSELSIEAADVPTASSLRVDLRTMAGSSLLETIAFYRDDDSFTQPHHPTNFVVLDTDELLGKELLCLPRQNDDLVKGTVVACRSAVGLGRGGNRERSIVMNNVLLIQPVGRTAPAGGHCGSVWALPGTRQAVAMTVGCGRQCTGAAVWLAVPVHACLLALCKQYPNVFEDPSLFRPL